MEVAVGFALNPELVVEYDSKQGPPNAKLKILSTAVQTAGSSANVATALHKLGRQPHLFGLVGAYGEYVEDILLKHVSQSLDFEWTPIPALNRTGFALLRVDRANPSEKVIGRRGEVLKNKTEEGRCLIRSCGIHDSVIRVATGVSISEVPLALALFERGQTILTPNAELLNHLEEFHRLLARTSILVWNENEADQYLRSQGIKKTRRFNIHFIGLRAIITTMGSRGGKIQVDGWAERLFSTQRPTGRILSTQGAGDWFLAGFITAMLESGERLSSLANPPESLMDWCVFGAKVAAKKLSFLGSGQGPSRGDIE
ncbi:MAG: hypothetical protein A2931_00525 [Candidatus Niyogibacteria bacterium RIFCSPLOWO2_01_FULL_45_48]|uniref:Carbohydrate kinase PfkB domain-containing protein n=2 Tax=Candidatus Niyogiibacteriota TaxID=1817912 RepID=A0A1G2F227_9BACT|nr:MAG: hypothetical protein A2931_00525 [Candidatus Niyogibacteria bacterium RIFCSPLOWO2_01_FULL_45_48]OGZ30329.1 MAG: hypothetical protein A2835_01770 [Candidatus Niyogibacteria bacterium RIFCSPHIGHO2_01_FULL_45_28]OGZ31611.1 MAG: hypothetical protein A3J00_00140 [Candidatus Niyogibacteria bacterium RIFCSPLOWO2_02_FULL_45_13]